MKKIPLLFIIIFSFQLAFSQNPMVKMWDYRFGGGSFDELMSLQKTSDGGFILGGWSSSPMGGDKSQDIQGNTSSDYWIVKLDSNGNKQWDVDLGGFSTDNLTALIQSYDRGYVFGGWSGSNSGGDKSQNVWGPYGFDVDYWIIKTDSLGNKQWDKDFGGTAYDVLHSIDKTFDGGFILGGSSYSEISGDKTQDTIGNMDYWIIKIDSLGNKQWDKDFGGTDLDELRSIIQTNDGGYILGGYSNSDSSGDKTQPKWGGADYWMIKVDSNGTKQWDKDFGGMENDVLVSLQQTSDGGFILSGSSNSGIGGDKTNDQWGGFSDFDIWIIKTDSLGNKIWDKDYGSYGIEDDPGGISQSSDGGYLIACTSYSSIGGDKTEVNLGSEQSWVFKIDSLGNKLWDKTALTFGHDESGFATDLGNGCYAIANYTDALIGGHKTQPCRGAVDYWIIKFCETLSANFTSPSEICPGTCIDFLNLSLQASNYQWTFPGGIPATSTDLNPNICYNASGSYDVQLIASNQTGSDTLLLQNFITVYPQPPPQGIQQLGDTLIANAGAVSYQWYYNGNIIQGATNYLYVAANSGDYNVVATDSNGCQVEAVINNVQVSVQFAESGLQFAVIPNPVTESLDIRGLEENSTFEITIYNVFGEKVFAEVNCKLLPIAIGTNCQLSPGVYYLQIDSSKKIYRTKFIKQ